MAVVADLDYADLQTYARIIKALMDPAPGGDVRRAIADELMGLLRADYFASFVWDESRARFTDVVATNLDSRALREYESHVFRADPLVAPLRRSEGATRISELMPRRRLEATSFYSTFLRSNGMAYGLCLFLKPEDRELGDFRIWRSADRPDFSDRETMILNALRPYLARAMRRRTLKLGITLTGRERQIAELAGRGLTDREICTLLGVAFGTVRVHLGRCLEKTGCRNRAELASWIISGGS